MVYYWLVRLTISEWFCYFLSRHRCQWCIIGLWDLPLQMVYYQLVRLNHLIIWCDFNCLYRIAVVCECVYVCVRALSPFWTVLKLKPVNSKYESILTPKCYFCPTHFPNYWFRNTEKEISIHAVILCHVLFALPKNIIVCLPCLFNNTVTDIVLHLMLGWLVNNELKRMYKAVAIA